mgnify:CR=1 FL=1
MLQRKHMRTVLYLAILVLVLWGTASYGTGRSPVGYPGSSDGMDAGVDLQGTPSPEFELTNQRDERVSLSDYRGKAIVLTFLDGHCDDVCPMLMETMARTEKILPEEAKDQVAFVVISVNPWLDRVGKPAFISMHPEFVAPEEWDFLTGTLEELQPVWKNYYIAVEAEETDGDLVSPLHTEGYYLIDPQGNQQYYYGGSVSEQILAKRLQEMLAASS